MLDEKKHHGHTNIDQHDKKAFQERAAKEEQQLHDVEALDDESLEEVIGGICALSLSISFSRTSISVYGKGVSLGFSISDAICAEPVIRTAWTLRRNASYPGISQRSRPM